MKRKKKRGGKKEERRKSSETKRQKDAVEAVACSLSLFLHFLDALFRSLRVSRTSYATRQVELGQPSIRIAANSFPGARIVPAMHILQPIISSTCVRLLILARAAKVGTRFIYIYIYIHSGETALYSIIGIRADKTHPATKIHAARGSWLARSIQPSAWNREKKMFFRDFRAIYFRIIYKSSVYNLPFEILFCLSFLFSRYFFFNFSCLNKIDWFSFFSFFPLFIKL